MIYSQMEESLIVFIKILIEKIKAKKKTTAVYALPNSPFLGNFGCVFLRFF